MALPFLRKWLMLEKRRHGLGRQLPERQPIDVLEAGMIGRSAETPVRYMAEAEESGLAGIYGQPMEFPELKVLYRSDTNAPLSVVGGRYQVVQPREVLEFYRDLTEILPNWRQPVC